MHRGEVEEVIYKVYIHAACESEELGRRSSSRALIRQGEAKRLNSNVETESEHYLFSQEQDRGCSLQFDDRHMEICEGSGRELYVIS
jgi:hypothetical protein